MIGIIPLSVFSSCKHQNDTTWQLAVGTFLLPPCKTHGSKQHSAITVCATSFHHVTLMIAV